MGRRSKYPAELRERAVRLVQEQQPTHPSQWAAITSIAEKIGCTAKTRARSGGEGDWPTAQVGAADRARPNAFSPKQPSSALAPGWTPAPARRESAHATWFAVAQQAGPRNFQTPKPRS